MVKAFIVIKLRVSFHNLLNCLNGRVKGMNELNIYSSFLEIISRNKSSLAAMVMAIVYLSSVSLSNSFDIKVYPKINRSENVL